MRFLLLLVLTLATVSVSAAEPANLSPVSTQFAGHYVSSFEKSLFKPLDSDERWWLSGAYSCPNTGIDLLPKDQSATAPVFLVVQGKLSAKGKHGHLGMYDRELVVERTIECRLLRASEADKIFGRTQ